MKTNQASFTVSRMSEVFQVSRSGFYSFLRYRPSQRAVEDAELLKAIRDIHQSSYQTYGSPRIHAELRERGIHVGRKRVERLMREDGLVGVSRRKYHNTTQRDPKARPAPDLVQRDFTATQRNTLWVADITYIPCMAGFLYLAVVLDVFSRRIVGWSMQKRQTSQIVLDALDMALQQRKPKAVIHHSDQGAQYTSIAFGNRCAQMGIRPSMGSVGDAYDNAMCESFFASLECELLDRNRFQTQAEAKIAVFQYIEGWYNPARRHSALGYLSPINYENKQHELHPT